METGRTWDGAGGDVDSRDWGMQFGTEGVTGDTGLLSRAWLKCACGHSLTAGCLTFNLPPPPTAKGSTHTH